MTSDLDSVLLAQAHMEKQVRDAAAVQVGLGRMWTRYMHPGDLDGSFPVYTRHALPLIAAGQERARAVATSYYAGARQLAGLDPEPPGLARPTPDYARISTSLLVTGPIKVKEQVAKGESLRAAMALAQAATLRSAKRHVLEAPRRQLIDLTKADGDAWGWSRISDGQPCYFCAMLCGRGPVYSEEGGRFQAHDGCGCSLKPAFGDDDGWTPTSRRLADLYEEAGDVNSFRAAYNKKIGSDTSFAELTEGYRNAKGKKAPRWRPADNWRK